MTDLSIVIAARSEQYLKPTVEDVIAHTSDRTEVIVIVDGGLPLEPLVQHPRVNVLLLPESIGQRAATNLGARLSTAPYICKLDAHASVAPNFDGELLRAAEQLGPDVLQVPRQYHLHVHNWRCDGCGTETYQGPTPTMCVACAKKGTPGGPFSVVWMWERRAHHWRTSTAKPSRRLIFSDTWRFDATLHFQYFPELAKRQPDGDVVETMSLLGACFVANREHFLRLGGLDTAHGSWGQFGQELAAKFWLSGGRVVTNRRTWYAHFFRVGGIGFPYPLQQGQVDHAREYARSLWLNDAWPAQVRPLRWLVEHFAPVPGWTQEQINALPHTLRRAA